MASSRRATLRLYKTLLRECQKLNSYNFRTYALEKAKYEFRANKAVTDGEQISTLLKKAQENLDIARRQVLVGQMYGEGHLVIENAEYMAHNKT
ncbi:LYR motif-containing protein 4-like [Mya arenaria]|uniref:LYR motif-containing protein 4-like n=1 Tax=Mya arenaria TaxID=6604 RepID=UPI0022E4464A|nr:LYR motif-containing protein 4-like [Mya arenaria]